MTTLALAYAKVQEIELPHINWQKVYIAGAVATVVLLVFYAWQINSLTANAYFINSYQKQISSLSEENKTLEISFVQNSFLGQAIAGAKLLNFQKATSIKYIQTEDSVLAKAR